MRVAIAVVCAGLVAGCVNNVSRLGDIPRLGSDDGAGKGPSLVAGVPYYGQEGFACGPAALAMMLGWAGVEVSPASLTTQLADSARDPRPGLMETASHYGRFAYSIRGFDAMRAELAAGHPVLVAQNLGVASKPLWNCPVAIGYAPAAGGQVVLNTGREAGKVISARLLDRLWADSDGWAMVVMRPGDLPATAREQPYVESARALERAGHPWEAVLAFDTALSQWPTNTEALMGLGTSLARLGDAKGAAEAFQTAASVAKDPTVAVEALARVQSDLKRPDEVASSAHRTLPINGGSAKPRRPTID
jgi:tetratricopeptide (TPR) repeat protein